MPASMAAVYWTYQTERDFILSLLHSLKEELLNTRKEMMASIEAIMRRLKSTPNPIRKDIVSSIHKALRSLGTYESTSKEQLVSWLEDLKITTQDRYHSHLYSQSPNSPLQVKHIAPSYDDKPIKVDGRIVIRDNFRALFDKYPELRFW